MGDVLAFPPNERPDPERVAALCDQLMFARRAMEGGAAELELLLRVAQRSGLPAGAVIVEKSGVKIRELSAELFGCARRLAELEEAVTLSGGGAREEWS